MSERRFHLRLAASTLAAVAVVLAWRATAPDPAPPRLVEARGELAADEAATIALFEESRSSVVFITTSARKLDPWSRDLEEAPRGAGSGVIWDAAGHVVTNAHVLAGASSALVRKADGTAVRAALVGMSPEHDLAVLRIPVDDAPLRPAPLGASRDLRVGQKVFAIGSPFGLDWTLTTGIVSALDREFSARGAPQLRGLIQTDAAINPGNSGGPLLDSAGRLIGVNTAIYSPSGASAGVGFAVPVDEVNRIVPQLIATGRYAPPSLGVESDARLNALAARRGIAGVVVLAVKPGSAAARAGVAPAQVAPEGGITLGDVIVGIDGTEIADPGDLRAALDPLEAGDEVEVTVLREGRRVELRATLEPG
jgi:S1-C subfamily serine protease